MLVLTSDVREAMRVSDRLLIMRKGRIVGELKPPNISYTQLTGDYDWGDRVMTVKNQNGISE